MSHWLLKTEPSEYSYDRLERDGRATWDGVTNPVAQKNLRAVAVGDSVVVYHTGNERAAVGLAEVERAAYPDRGDPSGKRVAIDLVPRGRLLQPVSLGTIKEEKAFAQSSLLRQGRLSVVPLTAEQFRILRRLAGG
jgi:predicted RNA-binding protein with PUA-like domain